MKESTVGAILTGIGIVLLLSGGRAYLLNQPAVEECDGTVVEIYEPYYCYHAERDSGLGIIGMAFGSIILTVGLILILYKMPTPDTWVLTCPVCRSRIDPHNSPVHCFFCGIPIRWSSGKVYVDVPSPESKAPGSRRVKR
jgi:hypothetical protein